MSAVAVVPFSFMITISPPSPRKNETPAIKPQDAELGSLIEERSQLVLQIGNLGKLADDEGAKIKGALNLRKADLTKKIEALSDFTYLQLRDSGQSKVRDFNIESALLKKSILILKLMPLKNAGSAHLHLKKINGNTVEAELVIGYGDSNLSEVRIHVSDELNALCQANKIEKPIQIEIRREGKIKCGLEFKPSRALWSPSS